MVMTKRKLLKLVDTERVVEAISLAEQQTSGEIRVSVARFFWGNIQKTADKAFERLGMTNTAERNGVLIFLVPARRRFVILGDSGIHEKVGQDFWEKIASEMSTHFKAGDFTIGLVKGIEEIGVQLASHFPYDKVNDSNELPNRVDIG